MERVKFQLLQIGMTFNREQNRHEFTTITTTPLRNLDDPNRPKVSEVSMIFDTSSPIPRLVYASHLFRLDPTDPDGVMGIPWDLEAFRVRLPHSFWTDLKGNLRDAGFAIVMEAPDNVLPHQTTAQD
jgi:hypothetical protein